MKEILKNPVSWGYSAPAIEVIELNVEGSICQASIADWESDGDVLDF